MSTAPCSTHATFGGRPLALRLQTLAARVRAVDRRESRLHTTPRPLPLRTAAANSADNSSPADDASDPLIAPVALKTLRRVQDGVALAARSTRSQHLQTAPQRRGVEQFQATETEAAVEGTAGQQQQGQALQQQGQAPQQRPSSAYGVAPRRDDLLPTAARGEDGLVLIEDRAPGTSSADDDSGSSGDHGDSAGPDRTSRAGHTRRGRGQSGSRSAQEGATAESTDDTTTAITAAAFEPSQPPVWQVCERPLLVAAPSGLSGLAPTLTMLKPGEEGGPAEKGDALLRRWQAAPEGPEDPEELLQVLQAMPPPRRRLVIFKSGGYIMSDLEALIESSGLDHVMRVTNLIRKAHCVLAKERWEDGRRVDVRQHAAGAAKRGLPFLLIKGHRLELVPLIGALRPLFVRRGIVGERSGVRKLRAVELGGLVWEIQPARVTAAAQAAGDEEDDDEDDGWLL